MRRIRLIGVAASRALVARRNENRDALRYPLLINRTKRSIRRQPIHRFTFAITNTDNRRRRRALIQQILQRDQSAECGGIGARCELNRCARRRSAGVLRIQNRLAIVSDENARIAAIVAAGRRRRMHLRERSRSKSGKPKRAAERSPVRGAVHVGIFNHHHRLALPGNPGVEHRSQVVNRGQIGRHDRLRIRGKRISRRAAHFVHRMRREIVQGNDTHHRGRQCRRDLRIAEVREMPHTVHFQAMNLGAESFADLSGLAGKIDHHAAGINHIDHEAVGLEPAGNGSQVLWCQAESLAEFLGADPVVIIRGAGRVQFIDKLVQRLFLFGGALQLQQHVLHRRIPGEHAEIVCGSGFGARIAGERNELRVAHFLGDQGPRGIRDLCLCGAWEAQDQENSYSGERGVSQDESSVHGAPLSERKWAVTRARLRPQRPKLNYVV